MEDYFKRAEELKESLTGNYEHSASIQDYELVQWLISKSRLLEKIANSWIGIETNERVEDANNFFTIVQDILSGDER